MREILFKGKRKYGGNWVEGYYQKRYDDFENIQHLIFWTKSSTVWEYAEVIPETICQYTGLEDKNGVKIWEHDLLEYSYEYPGSPWLKAKGLTDDDIRYDVGEVFFSEWRGTWSVCGRGRSRGMNQDIYKYSRNPNRTKVVGNVFDNPELIEK